MSSVSPANENQIYEESDRVATTSAHPAPPCTPIPPPPPPPPPPPELGDPTGGLRRQRRIRSFFWKPIPEEKVKGRANVWTQPPVQQQHYQIDVQTIEELFSQMDCQSPGVTTVTRGGKTRASLKETKDKIRILNSKTEMNVGIFLKHFKKSNQEIIEDIRHGNSKPYGAALLQDLLKLLPDTEEAKKLQAFNGDISKLSWVDSFMFLLTKVPSFEARIKAMALKEAFPPAFENTCRDINILQTATKELLGCEELHAVLHLVLQAGNILNAGSYAGNAVGFKLSSLLTLADTKANKPEMNLLHFVALEAQKKDEKLLEFPGKLQHVQSAARISLEVLDAELLSLSSHTHSVQRSIQEDTELLEQLDHFLKSWTDALVELQRQRQDLTKEGNVLIDFFCEDKESFKLDECFRVFQDFCLKFQKAVKDNQGREQRHHRLQQLEEKRHSWAGAEEVGVVSRIHSNSETDLGFLQQNRPRPHSPLSSPWISGSIRRPRGSALATADRQLTSLLTQGMTSDLQASPWRRVCREAEKQESSPFGSPETQRSPKVSPLTRVQTYGPPAPTPPQKHHPHGGTADLFDPQPDLNALDLSQTLEPVNSDSGPTTDRDPPGSLAISLERHTLVAGLHAFGHTPAPRQRHRHDSQGDDGVTTTDLEPGSDELSPVFEAEAGRREEKEGGFVFQIENQPPASNGDSSPDTPTASQSTDQGDDLAPGRSRPSVSQPTNEPSEPVSIADKSVPVSLEGNLPESTYTNQPEAVSPSTNQSEASSPPTSQSPLSLTTSSSDWSAHGALPKTTPVSKSFRIPTPTASQSQPGGQFKPGGQSSVRKQVIRTLNAQENQDMRRVVPISRRSSIPGKRVGKPPGPQGSEPGTPASSSNPANSSLRRTERVTTGSCRTRLQHEVSKDPKNPAVRGSAQDQPSVLQRRPSVKKTVRPVVPRQPPEEKICRATLRALAAAGKAAPMAGGEGSNSLSAPQTPSLCAESSNHPPTLPSFARNTAASTFRWTHSPLSSPGTVTPATTSPRSSPVPSLSTSPSPLSRGGSLRHHRVTPAGPPCTATAAFKRTQSIRGPSRAPQTSLPNTLPIVDWLAIPKGRARKDSTCSDRSTNSRASSRAQKPTWR
ncbi:hypothetical protein UPYG_G00244040 [Umbra pygmaea]|uniref:FH2 domain-containing protein n=1 Tax=Umbra pygmaea TaxID=75934 RepID=A0ABD0WFX6_UMBPY